MALLTTVLVGVAAVAIQVSEAVVMTRLAAVLLMLRAGLIVVSEFLTQVLGVLIVGASGPLLLTARRPVLRTWRYASVLLTAGTLASVLTGGPVPAAGTAVLTAVCGLLLSVERFTLGFARASDPARPVTAAAGAHPGTGERRGRGNERRLPGLGRWTRRGVVPVMINPHRPLFLLEGDSGG